MLKFVRKWESLTVMPTMTPIKFIMKVPFQLSQLNWIKCLQNENGSFPFRLLPFHPPPPPPRRRRRRCRFLLAFICLRRLCEATRVQFAYFMNDEFSSSPACLNILLSYIILIRRIVSVC